MSEKRTIWAVIGGAAVLTGYRTLRTGSDPIPQLAGIGAAGVMLLFVAEITPKFASGLAVLMGVAFAYSWQPTEQKAPGTGGPLTGAPTAPPQGGGGGGGGAW